MFLLRRKQFNRDLDEEIQLHLEMKKREQVETGITAEEAHYAARRQFGNTLMLKERSREMWGWNSIEQLIQDVRYGARQLRLSPGFATVAILSLALGIGANTAIFQLLDAVRLRSLPVRNPQELAEVRIAGSYGGMGITNGFNVDATNPLWEQIRDHQQAFTGVFAWSEDMLRVGEGREARRAQGMWVSGDFFSVLGVPPVRGRLLSAEDDRRGCGAGGVVISYAFWQREFGGGDSAVGSKLVVQDHPFEVIGVTPATFFGLEVGRTFDVALPICGQAILGNGTYSLERHDVWWLTVMGRLNPGWTLARASAHLNAISPGLFEATELLGYEVSKMEAYRKFRLEAIPAGTGVSWLRTMYDTSLWVLLGITGLVLMIACANLANLMLARASAREREMALRLALGASRGRLMRQLLSESLLLAASGAVLGACLARVLSRGILWLLSAEGDAMRLDLSMDWRLLAFTAALAILTCVVFGLAPALRSSRMAPSGALKAGGRGLTAGRERFSFQRLLVVTQIVVSLVLLVGAVLFVRSFRNLVTLDPGFQAKGIVISVMNLTRLHLAPERIQSFQTELLEKIRAIPQVESAASTTNIPLSGNSWTLGIRVPGEDSAWSKFTWVSPQYFRTMEIPLLAGRDFSASDTATSGRVAVVNLTFARKYFGAMDPIGKTIRTISEPNYPEATYEIVGVVKDTKYAGLRQELQPITFAPAPQHPAQGPWSLFVIRSAAPLGGVISAVKQNVGAAQPEIVMDFDIFETLIREGMTQERMMAALAGFFGGLAALLATIGLYGVVSYTVVRRRNEIGIRVALGAQRRDVLWMVLRETLLLVTVGIVIGIPCVVAATRLVSSLLFGLKPGDPATIGLAISMMIVVALVAGYLPARRASRVDPMVALRAE